MGFHGMFSLTTTIYSTMLVLPLCYLASVASSVLSHWYSNSLGTLLKRLVHTLRLKRSGPGVLGTKLVALLLTMAVWDHMTVNNGERRYPLYLCEQCRTVAVIIMVVPLHPVNHDDVVSSSLCPSSKP